MTWRELMKYIATQDPDTLDEEVKVYIYGENSEYNAEITELLEDGWIPYIAINDREA